MEDELQGKLVEILASIQSATGKAADFTMGQLPDIAQQYVAYGMVLHTTQLAISVAIFAFGVVLATRFGFMNTKAVHRGGFQDGDWHGGRVVAAIAGSISALVGLIATINTTQSAALVWFAPKVWLIKELAQLVKGSA